MVEDPLPPCANETGEDTDKLKPLVGTELVSAAKRPAFGLPQPVTRS